MKKIGKKLMAPNYIENVIKVCAKNYFIVDPRWVNSLDSTKPNLVGFENGVYDLETLTFRPSKPEDMVSLSTGYDFIPETNEEARTIVMRFLESITRNEEMLTYLLYTLSHGLTGKKRIEKFYFWIGNGGNGKGVLDRLLSTTLGNYYYNPDVSMYTTKRGNSSAANSELASSKGKRILVSTEPEQEDKINIGFLKKLSGGDKIQARRLYENFEEFVPSFMSIIQTNSIPDFSGIDGGLARRLCFIEFPWKFVATPSLPHERRLDVWLKEKLEQPIYAMEMFRILTEAYGTSVETPAEVEEHIKNVIEDQNDVAEFISEYLTCEETAQMKRTDLANYYRDNGGTLGKNAFLNVMKSKGFQMRKRNGGIYYCIGVKEKTEAAVDFI